MLIQSLRPTNMELAGETKKKAELHGMTPCLPRRSTVMHLSVLTSKNKVKTSLPAWRGKVSRIEISYTLQSITNRGTLGVPMAEKVIALASDFVTNKLC